MKKSISIFMAASVAVAAMVSCQKETPTTVSNEKTISFFANSIETKTAFGTPTGTTYPTLWTANDSKVGISMNFATPKDGAVTPSADYTTATFDVTFEAGEATAFTFYSVSPKTSFVSANTTYNSLNVEVPSSQTPIVGSVDEAAQVLVAKSEEYSSFPSSVELNYSHYTAYGKMTIKNLSIGEATVESISLTAAENWAGRWYYYPATGSTEVNSGTKTITLTTDKTSDVFFACAPVDLGGKTIKVSVNTTSGSYVKEVTIPAGKKFESGKIAKFSVDFTGVTPAEDVVYNLVTSTDDLTVDSEVILVSGSYAMSTTQNSGNRPATAVTVSDNTIKNPSDAVQVLTVGRGSVDESISLYTGAGYLYAASSSSNYLRTQTSLDANASFSVSFSSNNAVLTAQGSYTRNVIKYNASSTLFSCYASSSSMDAVQLYKKAGSGSSIPAIVVLENLTAPVISDCVGDDDAKTVTVTWTDVENATSYLVACGTETQTVNAGVEIAEITVAAYGTYSVTVTAQADGYRSATSTSVSVTLTDPSITVLSTGEVTALTASTTAQSLDDKISYVMSAANTYSSPLRVYSGNTLTITAATGYNITSVVFNCNSASYATVCSGATVTLATGASATSSTSDTAVTYTVSGTTSSFAIKASAQWRVDGITVNYVAAE